MRSRSESYRYALLDRTNAQTLKNEGSAREVSSVEISSNDITFIDENSSDEHRSQAWYRDHTWIPDDADEMDVL